MNLTVQSVSFNYPGKVLREALSGISFSVESGSFVAVIGPSGCGKSTLLRLMANLLEPDEGSIEVDGRSPRALVAERRIAWMSQQPALLPWLSVIANITLATRFHSPDFSPRLSPQEVLSMVRLEDAADVYPHMLSGGMQQRLALARTLMLDAGLWLMDEPFAALDELTRERLTGELAELWSGLRPTVFWVTHNIYEAIHLSDRILVMSPAPGRLVTDINVDLPRPRVEASVSFQQMLKYLRDTLETSQNETKK